MPVRARYLTIENVVFADFRLCYRCSHGACETCLWGPGSRDQTARELDTRELWRVLQPEPETAEVLYSEFRPAPTERRR
jgi:hypothetical protein